MDPRAICDAPTRSLAATQAALRAYLAPFNEAALAARPPPDVMQLHFGLGQLEAYEGRMDGAIARFEEALRIADAEVPGAALQMEEALGIAHLHKAGMDNNALARPGELCLLYVRSGLAYSARGEIEKAIDYFQRYLDQKSDELEVRWLLNVASMMAGAHPDKVPARYLIPPAAFESREDVGHFLDVAAEAGLDRFASAGVSSIVPRSSHLEDDVFVAVVVERRRRDRGSRRCRYAEHPEHAPHRAGRLAASVEGNRYSPEQLADLTRSVLRR